MLLTQNFQVFVKFMFDLQHSFAPRNPGKTHEFVVPKNVSKKTRKIILFLPLLEQYLLASFSKKYRVFKSQIPVQKHIPFKK